MIRPTASARFGNLDDIVDIPVNNIRFEAITAKEVPTSEFKSIGRSNKLLQ